MTDRRSGLLGLPPGRPRPTCGSARRCCAAPARVHLVKDPVTGARLEVGAKEHFVIARLDGHRSLDEIGAEYAAAFGARLGEAQWTADAAGCSRSAGCSADGRPDPPVPPSAACRRPAPRGPSLGRFPPRRQPADLAERADPDGRGRRRD